MTGLLDPPSDRQEALIQALRAFAMAAPYWGGHAVTMAHARLVLRTLGATRDEIAQAERAREART